MALAEVFEALAGPDAPVEFRAYDGSQAGPAGSAVKIAVRSLAAAYLAQAPGGLGLARGLRSRAPGRRGGHVRDPDQDDP
jgi:cyclopropane-fatty-acyl-phospholipid synthase